MPTTNNSIGCFISGSVRVVEYPFDIDTSDFYSNVVDTDTPGPTDIYNGGNVYEWNQCNYKSLFNQVQQKVYSTSPSGLVSLINTSPQKYNADQTVYITHYYGDYPNKIGLVTRVKPVGPSGNALGGFLFCIDNGENKLYKKSNPESVNSDWDDLLATGSVLASQYSSYVGNYRLVASGNYILGYYGDTLDIEYESDLYTNNEYSGHGLYVQDNRLDFDQTNEMSFSAYNLYTQRETEYWTEGPASGIPLYINYSTTPSESGIPLYTISIGTASETRTLYTKSSMFGSGEFPLYMAGHIQSYSGMPLYTVSIGDSSGLFPLHVLGTESSASGFPTFIEGMIQSSGAIPLYIINQPTTTNIALYIHDLHEPVNKSVPLYLYNSATNKQMDLVVWGYTNNPNSTDSAVPVNGTFALFTDGGGVHNNVPLYTICGTGETSNELQLYITANESASGVFPLFMDSYDSHVKTLKCYAHGY